MIFAPRPARDDDAQDLCGLVALCFSAFPGCFLDPHDDMPDLLRPASAWSARGGSFWVVEDGRGRVAAAVALDAPLRDALELHRLYVRPDCRRHGWGTGLVTLVETEALRRRVPRVGFWSDTRFLDAHRLYLRLGYRDTGETRELGDVSGTTEKRFDKTMPLG